MVRIGLEGSIELPGCLRRSTYPKQTEQTSFHIGPCRQPLKQHMSTKPTQRRSHNCQTSKISREPRIELLKVCTHRLPCTDRKQAHRIRIGDWRPGHKQIRFVSTTVSTSAHWPQNSHFRNMIEQKPSIERVVIESSNQRLSLTSPCERAVTISFAPSAEFSDTKVLDVVTQSGATFRRML